MSSQRLSMLSIVFVVLVSSQVAVLAPPIQGQSPPAPNDDCENALEIGNGSFGGDFDATNDGNASCDGTFPDLWFRYTAPETGQVVADSFFAGQTALSVHTSCPGTLTNEIACASFNFPQGTAVAFEAEAGADYWIRYANCCSGGSYSLNVAPAGAISGTVTDTVTGAPLPSITVSVGDGFNLPIATASTGPTGEYTVGGLPAGSYVAYIRSPFPYLPEVYDDVPCQLGCDPSLGTPLSVDAGETLTGIDFALSQGGVIAGTVTEATSGQPIEAVEVQVWDEEGFLISSGFTNALGDYAVGRLYAGDLLVTTRDAELLDVLYDDVPCPGGLFVGCEPAEGTPVTVSLDTTTPGIDFALERLGAIAGTVTDNVTGAPVASVQVLVWDQTGNFLASGFTDETGRYTTTGLDAGLYFATTSNVSGYQDELYNDIPCQQPCDVTFGNAIPVALDQITTDIDFALERLGTISGTVTAAGSGDPVEAVLYVFNRDGFAFHSGTTDASGRYTIDGLAPGTYTVAAETFLGTYAEELYDDIACPGGPFQGCDPTTGTPVEVAFATTTSGIDFVLEPGTRCVSFGTSLCLNDGRFEVEVTWEDFDGNSGLASAEQLTDDSGYFWFFDLDNVEMVVKVLDACATPFESFWVFAGGLTNVRTEMVVTDQETGDVTIYSNPLGSAFQPIRDTAAFDTCAAGAAAGPLLGTELQRQAFRELERLLREPALREPALREAGDPSSLGLLPGPCDPSALCLNDGRFQVEATWRTPDGDQGTGEPVHLTADTGTFWFFDPDNVEMVVKILDACELAPFQNFWVFAAGLTDVEVTLTVTDIESGEVQRYFNPQGSAFVPVQDTGSFRTCL